MPSLNKVILIGHLTADPELKTTQSGNSVCSFKIGVTRRYTSSDHPESDFISIVAWRKTAEFISKYFRKGQAICVCGSIQTRSYDDKDGKKVYVTEVVADEASFAEKRSLEPTDEERNAPSPKVDAPKFESVDLEAEELPF